MSLFTARERQSSSLIWLLLAGGTATTALVATSAAVLLLRRISDAVGVAPPTPQMEEQETATQKCALLRHLPHLRLAWRSLGAVTPTPLHKCTITTRGNLQLRFWVKREDLICTDTYGGNKVRTLQHQLAVCEARRDTGESAFCQLVCLGTGGSNQIVATAVHAQRLGWTAQSDSAVNVNWFDKDEADLDNTLNYLSTLSLPIGWSYNWGEPWRLGRIISAFWQTWTQKSFIPMNLGGNCATGVLGQVSGALELAEQLEKSKGPRITRLYVPVGSSCTVSGLIVGTVLAQHLGYTSLDDLCIVGCNVHELIAMMDRCFSLHVSPLFSWMPLTVSHSVTQACRALVQVGGPDLLDECLAFCRNPHKFQMRSDKAVVGKYGGHSDLTRAAAQLYDSTGIVKDDKETPAKPLWICGHFVGKALQPLLVDLEQENEQQQVDVPSTYLLWMTKSAIQPRGDRDEWELFLKENASVHQWANRGKAESSLRPGRVSTIDGTPEEYRSLMTPIHIE